MGRSKSQKMDVECMGRGGGRILQKVSIARVNTITLVFQGKL